MSKPKKIRARFGGTLKVEGACVGDLTMLTIDVKTTMGRAIVHLSDKATRQLLDAINEARRLRGHR